MPSFIASRYCACMCGATVPQHAEFMPGHALRYTHSLRRSARNGSREARNELYARGWQLDPHRGPGVRAFGFEAEFYGMSQDDAASRLTEAGIPAQQDGYHHNARDYWRVTEDGSVSGEGCELVSPILTVTDKEHMRTSRKALDTIRSYGGQVNRTCGLHVHHNLKSKTVEDVAETVGHWALFQSQINTMLPPSRHEGDYANSMFGAQNWYDSVAAYGLDNGATRLTQGDWGRYHAVNLQAIDDHGTLEYRQHSGTLNPDKLEHWAEFTRAMHDVSRIGKMRLFRDLYGSYEAASSELTLGTVLEYLRLPLRTRKFLIERAATLFNGTMDDNEQAEEEFYDPDADEDAGIWCENCNEYHYDG